ncbi:MAG TPA: hydroxymethylglutaryl-CoA reductase, degradative [Flavobacteriaceae bacterium]|nr:hydroxymethylglutaryl-CoA reductase, degradative [Flavobacteriaceae bacterium]
MSKEISGFSKLSKEEKINWIVDNFFTDTVMAKSVLKQYWNEDDKLQKLHDEFSENTLSNFYLPFSIAPNFLINGKKYSIPMVIEESSVIAAASKSAKLWSDLGGFKAKVISKIKTGQVHFTYTGDKQAISSYFNYIKPTLIQDTESITINMKKRGGGIIDVSLIDKTFDMKGYYQISVSFDTIDAMGANFINSCLEQISKSFKDKTDIFKDCIIKSNDIKIIMNILSNYVPDCLVKAEVSCKVEKLNKKENFNGYCEKFVQAVKIAELDTYRAVTHNKGIMNGIDAIAVATGNDFRAIEAGIHAYASKDGKYRSLTHAKIENGVFLFSIEIPLALGTIGGITNLHPLVKLALNMLDDPNAEELMEITAAVGLAQNYGALRSLITSGIQKGHMKMHLINILNSLEATESEKQSAVEYFKDEIVNNNNVQSYITKLRKSNEI